MAVRNLIITSLLFVSSTIYLAAVKTLSAQEVAADGVTWLRSAEQAASLSAQSGKPILVYVRSANCHYCDLMQKNVWQDPATVQTVMREFIPLKLTQEENPEAVKAMQIKGFPSTLIFSADRKYLSRIDGYVTVEKFRTTVTGVLTASSADTQPVVR
jgi:uncharacterized protein YyaL (SSP411 family)